jgi:hypothetical protein
MWFPLPLLPAVFEIPDDWLDQAGMSSFTPSKPAYVSAQSMDREVRLREIEPPFRLPEYPLDHCGFVRQRMVNILTGFVTDAPVPPVDIIELTRSGFRQLPFRFRLVDGMHRFYGSLAAGFTHVPVRVLDAG